MKTQRSALLGLVLGLAVFGAACEDKTEVVIPPEPDPPIVVTVTPQQLNLQVGQSATLAAAVTGGSATAAKTVTWSTSSAAVATVDASGKVTAVAAGVATVTATSTADAAAKAAAAITVTTPPTPAQPSVSIKSITQFATTIPVALDNVFGQIDITLNLDVPAGTKISALRTYINNTKVCEQTFSAGAEVGATEEVNGAADIICSVNTAAYTGTPGTDNQATITFPNGPGYKVKAEIVGTQGTVVAQIASADMMFKNPSFIVAVKTAPTNCTTGAVLLGASFWCGGDITANFLPVNFSTNANDVVNSITLTASTGAAATDNASGWSATLQKAATPAASSIAGVEGPVGLTVTSTTVGGQTGPLCVNPDPVLNPIGFCAVATWVNGTGGLPATAFLVDNVAPAVTLFDITPAFICAGSAAPACYVNGAFLFSVRSGFFAHVDGGVSAGPAKLPTAVFAAGLPGAEVTVTSGADMAESATSQTFVVKATTTDALGNARTVWASTNNAVPVTSATSASVQKFGVDKTNPTHVTTTAANGAINKLPAASGATYTDAGVGPSGFLANPVRVKINRITATTNTCHNPDTGAAIACTTSTNPNAGFVADDGNFAFLTAGPIPDGYYIITTYVIDQAGNVSATETREVLNDVTAPIYSGGIVAPSTIAGGAAVAFSSALSDNIELGSLEPYIGYASGIYLAWPRQTIGSYGSATLNGTDAGNVSIGAFIRSVQTNNGAGLPSGTINAAQSVNYAIRDVAGHELRFAVAPWTAAPNDGVCPAATAPNTATQNCATRDLSIAANVAGPLAGIFPQAYGAGAAPNFNCLTALSNCDLIGLNGANALHGLFVMQAPSNLTACNSASTTTANCTTATNDNLVTLTATLTGPVSVFVSPFTEVQFRYLDPELKWQYIGSAGAPSVTDNTVTSTRTVTYTLVWDVSNPKVRPGTLAGTVYNVIALARNATGDGLLSTGQTVTVQGN